MDPNNMITIVLLIISYIFIVTFSIFFDKISNRIAKVLKKSPDKAKRDVKFFQIGAIFLLIASFYMTYSIIFVMIPSEKFEASDIIILLLLFSISTVLLEFSAILKRGIELIEKRNVK